jgi:hypothetical protein
MLNYGILYYVNNDKGLIRYSDSD